jgi:hypothetical protein
MFVSEFGEDFSEHIKQKLLDLEVPCVLTRKDDTYILDLKHVEHTKHDYYSEDKKDTLKKEYVYGQFIVIDGVLYFSEKCTETDEVVQSPIVSNIYNSLSNESVIYDSDKKAKQVDDSNIDYIIDNILTVCPRVSQSYLNILQEMTSRSDDKAKNMPSEKKYR